MKESDLTPHAVEWLRRRGLLESKTQLLFGRREPLTVGAKRIAIAGADPMTIPGPQQASHNRFPCQYH